MTKRDTDSWELPAIMVIALPLSAHQAWVGQYLWTWFIHPVFGVQTPSLWVMAGLFLVARFPSIHTNGNGKPLGYTIVFSLIGPLIAFVFGWTFHTLAGVFA